MKFINRDVALACFDDWTDLNGNIRSADENPVYKKIKTLPTVDLIFDGEEEENDNGY